MTDFYTRLASYYDQMYSFKDYKSESEKLHEVIQQFKKSNGNRLLDVACGTGGHLIFLRENYEVTGLDASKEMLAVARKKLEDIPLLHASMVDMELTSEFDVITCLFGSIGYLATLGELTRAIRSFAKHLTSGGVLILEPIFTKETVKKTSMGLSSVDLPDIKIARVNSTRVEEDTAYLNFHFLVATRDGVEHFVDPSPMGVFPRNRFIEIMEDSGLSSEFVEPGLSKEGLFIGVKN
ncbi:MAG: class I SAM-dependent methyltransferase [Candidatus Thorarchaeota archaeon]|nr:MAG: class I SAM-dependent methyltransferase [Candidatus Thorarchaeota archaeon]